MTQLALEGIGRSVDPDAEFFPTPARLCEALVRKLDQLHLIQVETVIEPSAGDGAFVRAARARWPLAEILAIDIRITEKECLAAGATAFEQWDWMEFAPTQAGEDQPRLILGNPPFSPAAEHITAAHDNFPEGTVVAFLLRLGFLASADRVPFWKAHPLRALFPIAERPAFEKGTTDLHDYGFFVWQLGYRGKAELMPGISWR